MGIVDMSVVKNIIDILKRQRDAVTGIEGADAHELIIRPICAESEECFVRAYRPVLFSKAYHC